MDETRIGYLVDLSNPPLVFTAIQGLGEVLEHGFGGLEPLLQGLSPVLVEGGHRLVVINLGDPEPISIEVIQHAGRLERMTEIFGVGIGMGVLREVRRTAKALDVALGPLSIGFRRRIERDKGIYLDAYGSSGRDGFVRESGLTRVLERLRDTGGGRSGSFAGEERIEISASPSFLFRLRLPKAIDELEHAIQDTFSGALERVVLEHVSEVASALAQAFQSEGLREAAGLARSIASLTSVSPGILGTMEKAFRDKLAALLTSLKKVVVAVLSETGS